jgi:hydrogenase maturation protease
MAHAVDASRCEAVQEARPDPAPLLVVAVGNPSRGDDAIGPLLVERLREAGVEAGGRVELLTDFQLQVEHALDLAGRCAVLFVDAALPGRAGPDGVLLQRLQPDEAVPAASHALRPGAVLRVFRDVHGTEPPPAWLLAVEGGSFELGAGLTPRAGAHLESAVAAARAWLRAYDPAPCAHPSPAPSS